MQPISQYKSWRTDQECEECEEKVGGWMACHSCRTMDSNFKSVPKPFSKIVWKYASPKSTSSSWSSHFKWPWLRLHHVFFSHFQRRNCRGEMGPLAHWLRWHSLLPPWPVGEQRIQTPGRAGKWAKRPHDVPSVGLPSGELTFCHGKSPFVMGKSIELATPVPISRFTR